MERFTKKYQYIEFLASAEFRDAVRALMKEHGGGDWFDEDQSIIREYLPALLDQFLCAKAEEPYIITSEDMVDAACEQLAGVAHYNELWDWAVSRFVARCFQREYLADYSFDIGKWCVTKEEKESADMNWDLWGKDELAYLSLMIRRPKDGRYFAKADVYFEGFTERAARRCTKRMKTLVRSVATVIHTVADKIDSPRYLELSTDGSSIASDAALIRAMANFVGDKDERQVEEEVYRSLERQGIVAARELLTDYAKQLFAWTLDSHFSSTRTKKSTKSLGFRVYHAIEFLGLASKQESPAVSLSLRFAALEALFGDTSENITEKLRARIATLLEPDAHARTDAMNAISKLYTLRSKTMHGSSIDGDEETSQKVHRLACAALVAIARWYVNQSADQEKETKREDLLTQLDSKRDAGDVVTGAPTDLAKFLP